MNLVFFTHPDFLGLNSMIRYAEMLASGMEKRGHSVQTFTAKSKFANLLNQPLWKKWLGYIDQYIIFPGQIRTLIKNKPNDTLFIFTDHALGPWVPLIAKRPHVIHCHDFMAQLSAVNELPANTTGSTGKLYQYLIRKGFKKGINFICVSHKTKRDLQRFIPSIEAPVVYNGLNKIFNRIDPRIALQYVSAKTGIDLSHGYIVHVGGNQWYKNRTGVIEIYNAWRLNANSDAPLLLIGKKPSLELQEKYRQSKFQADIYFIEDADDQFVSMAYCGATLLLFPSIMEGFGWPIAEAMACGSLVITTNEAPMTEVAGCAAFLIPLRPLRNDTTQWAEEAAQVVKKIFTLHPDERERAVISGLQNAKRFTLEQSLDQIEALYKSILQKSKL